MDHRITEALCELAATIESYAEAYHNADVSMDEVLAEVLLALAPALRDIAQGGQE